MVDIAAVPAAGQALAFVFLFARWPDVSMLATYATTRNTVGYHRIVSVLNLILLFMSKEKKVK